MIKAILATLMLAAPVALYAQAAPIGPGDSMNGPNYSTYLPGVENRGPWGNRETPAMQRSKLIRAVALRDEAARLATTDGGTLSPNHLRYIQRKVDAILKGR